MRGEATVLPQAGKSFDPALIPKAIHDAGFTATKVTVVADGTLTAKDGSLELNVPGLKHPFVLAGGTGETSLKKQGSLVGKKIQVGGKVIAGHGGSPPSLTVEKFQPLN